MFCMLRTISLLYYYYYFLLMNIISVNFFLSYYSTLYSIVCYYHIVNGYYFFWLVDVEFAVFLLMTTRLSHYRFDINENCLYALIAV